MGWLRRLWSREDKSDTPPAVAPSAAAGPAMASALEEDPDAAQLHRLLVAAAQANRLKEAETYLSMGADPNWVARQSPYASDPLLGQTALCLAAGNGSVALVRLLLSCGARPDRTSDEGRTPLMEAARVGSSDVVRLLLRRSNVGAADADGRTALAWAAAGGHAKVAALLGKGGQTPERLDTALRQAIRSGCGETVEAVLRLGADVSRADPEGVTPLTFLQDLFVADELTEPQAARIGALLARRGARLG